MTVNTFMSISLNPLLIVPSIDEGVCMHNKYSQFKHEKSFGVSMLNVMQQELLSDFARQNELIDGVHLIVQSGVPVIEGALAKLSCESV